MRNVIKKWEPGESGGFPGVFLPNHIADLLAVFAGGGGREDIYKKDYPFKADPYPYITEGEGTNLFINKMRERNRLVTDVQTYGWADVDKGHYNMLDSFVDCILLDAPSVCGALDGSRATLMCLKARESARLGLPVKISEDEYNYIFAD